VGSCANCDHEGVLPGINDDRRPTCRKCSGIRVPLDCKHCGAEAPLYRREMCWRCALAQEINRRLTGPEGAVPVRLRPLADLVNSMENANSGITWLHNKQVRWLLAGLACGDIELSHEGLDSLPYNRRVDYLRGLLVSCAVLPARDRYLAMFDRWQNEKLATVENPDHARVLEQFVRWHVRRHLLRKAKDEPLQLGPFVAAKQNVTVAMKFLAWLGSQQVTLGDCAQDDLDTWFANGPATFQSARPFLWWAMGTHQMQRLDVPEMKVRARPRLSEDERIALLRKVLLSDTMALPYRVAAGLILLFGRTAVSILRLRVTDVRSTRNDLRVRFSKDWISIPEPFAALLRLLIDNRPNMQTAANPESPWIFPGIYPGEHLGWNALVSELARNDIPVLAARSGSWQAMTRATPIAVLAKSLGVSIITATRHANAAGTDWMSYVATKAP
jgi:integrase